MTLVSSNSNNGIKSGDLYIVLCLWYHSHSLLLRSCIEISATVLLHPNTYRVWKPTAGESVRTRTNNATILQETSSMTLISKSFDQNLQPRAPSWAWYSSTVFRGQRFCMPNLHLIGVRKCGTADIFKWFNAHADVTTSLQVSVVLALLQLDINLDVSPCVCKLSSIVYSLVIQILNHRYEGFPHYCRTTGHQSIFAQRNISEVIFKLL